MHGDSKHPREQIELISDRLGLPEETAQTAQRILSDNNGTQFGERGLDAAC